MIVHNWRHTLGMAQWFYDYNSIKVWQWGGLKLSIHVWRHLWMTLYLIDGFLQEWNAFFVPDAIWIIITSTKSVWDCILFTRVSRPESRLPGRRWTWKMSSFKRRLSVVVSKGHSSISERSVCSIKGLLVNNLKHSFKSLLQPWKIFFFENFFKINKWLPNNALWFPKAST